MAQQLTARAVRAQQPGATERRRQPGAWAAESHAAWSAWWVPWMEKGEGAAMGSI